MEADALAEVARRFAGDRLAPAMATGGFDRRALLSEAASLGLAGIEVPRAAGGQGATFEARIGVCRALAEVDFGFAMALVNSHNVALRLSRSGRHGDVVTRLVQGKALACTAISEPAAGSDVAAMTTTATREGDGYRLSGGKHWIVNGREADFAIVYPKLDGAGIAAFLVDLHARGVQIRPQDSSLSQSTIGCGAMGFEDVKLEREAMLLPPETALREILGEINLARIYVAAMAGGMVSGALTEATRYGATRQTFGASLGDHQAWRLTLAKARCDLDAVEALVDRAASARESSEMQRLAASAKVVSTAAARRHIPSLLHAMGARGLDPDLCFARHHAATPLLELVDGATEMLLERVARLTIPTDKERPEP